MLVTSRCKRRKQRKVWFEGCSAGFWILGWFYPEKGVFFFGCTWLKVRCLHNQRLFCLTKVLHSFLIWNLFTVNFWKIQIQNKIKESNASWPETIWTKRAHLGTVNFKEMSEYLWETQSATRVVSVCNWTFSVS